MGHPNSSFTLGIPFASSDGKFYSLYPQGDKFSTFGAASGALASVVASAPNGSASQLALQFKRQATFEFGIAGSNPVNSTIGVDSIDGAELVSTIDDTRAYAGTRSMKCAITVGTNRMGGIVQLKSAINGGFLAPGDEVWVRSRIYIPSSWSITTGDGGMKFFRYRAYIAGGVPAGSNTMQLWGSGPAPSGLRTEAEGFTPDTRLFTPAGGWNDRWVTFEFYIKLGTGTTGILRSWVDGVLRGEVLSVDTIGSTSFLSLDCHFLDYFNNGAPQNQAMWIDTIDVAWSGLAVPPTTDAAGNHFIGTG